MIIIPKDILRAALAGLRVLKLNRQTLPVLSRVQVIGTGDTVEFTGTQLDQFLHYRGQGQSDRPTRVLVPYDMLQSAAKTADGDIHITDGDRPALRYVVGGTSLDLPMDPLSTDEFPPTPEFAGSGTILPEGVLGAMNEASSSASTDATRYVLNSVYVERHAVVATDGRQLYRRNSLDLPVPEAGLIFPASDVLGVLPDGPATLWLNDGSPAPLARIQVGPWIWITKLVEASYPNYRQVVPKLEDYGIVVRLSEQDLPRLKAVLSKMPGFKEKDSPLRLVVNNGQVCLRTVERLPKVKIDLPKADLLKTGSVDVAFNARYLLLALQRGMRTLHVRDHVSPLMMTDDARLHLWMPLRDVGSSSPPQPEEPAQKPVNETNRNAAPVSADPGEVTRVPTVSPEAPPARVPAPLAEPPPAEGLTEKLQRLRDLGREFQAELASLHGLVRDSQRQFKTLERDHEALKRNIRALRAVGV